MASTERGPADDTTRSKKASAKDSEFLRKVVKQFARAESAESKNRQMALDDLKFKMGDQWPEDIKASRTIEKRPCLTINKMKTFVHQITNDQRQNRPAINISPIGDKSDPQTAKDLKGLIKSIERASNADVAYDTGFDSAVSMGWGYWRILTEYEYPDSFEQCIRIKPLRNPFRVYLDPDSQEPDGSDAKWGFISDMLPTQEFKDLYPKADVTPWAEGSAGDEYKLWNTETHVRIAEYFCYETTNRTLVRLQNGHVGFEDELAPALKDSPRVESREVQEKKVKWYKLTSKQVLEESDWLGECIPIVKVVGDVVDIEGKPTLAGLIRDAKDPQRMYNFWVTSETELIALAPKAPWIMEEGQVEGHERRWQDANNKSLPYLLYKGVNVGGKPAPPPQRQQFAGPPAGVVQAKISAAQDIQAVTGIRFDATLQERNYDESGKALRELKRVGDIGNFHYIDNLSRSLKFTGKILIDLIPKVIDGKRMVTILREDDTEEQVMIDPTQGQPGQKVQMADGRIARIMNPNLGKYDVTVTVGPSFATKRAEAADSMLQFMRYVPNAAPLVGDLIAKNMDWPGADEISARLQASLPPHLINKKLDNLPPEARGVIMNLTQQIQQMKQERDQAVMMLGDKEKDRDIDRQALANESEKIRNDFEAKVQKIQEDFIVKMAAIQAKSGESTDDGSAAADFIAKMAKIEADLQAKLEKNELDFEAKMAALDVKVTEAKSKVDTADKDRELQGKALRRNDDVKKLHDRIEDLGKEVKDIAKEVKEAQEMEVVFERDPSTKRISKARKVKANGAAHK